MSEKRLTGRLSEQTYDRFMEFRKDYDRDDTALNALLERAEHMRISSATPTLEDILDVLPLDEEGKDTIIAALQTSIAGDWRNFVKAALWRHARTMLTNAKNLENVDVSTREGRSTKHGAAELQVQHTLKMLMDANSRALPHQRFYISQRVLAGASGVSLVTVQRLWPKYLTIIENHNKEMGFNTPVEGRARNREMGVSFRPEDYAQPENVSHEAKNGVKAGA